LITETDNNSYSSRTARLGIGTVQFGQDYAIDAAEVRPDDDEIARILHRATAAAVRVLDTASAYGNAEEVLGRLLAPGHQFRIVTKTPVFDGKNIRYEDRYTLTAALQKSLEALGTHSVYGLMIHKASNLTGEGGEHLFDAMLDLKRQALVEKIGVSVYDAGEIENVLARFPVDLVQVPVSILDQRLVAGGQLSAMKKRGIEIHARSVFLKGLVFVDPANLPDHFSDVREQLAHFREEVAACGATPQAVALSYVLDHPDIDTVLCGVTSSAQLGQIIDSLVDTGAFLLPDPQRFALNNPEILNPARWPALKVANP
jgi:aryl-alcohol dehydrogenase-like predicted oxidoreductase